MAGVEVTVAGVEEFARSLDTATDTLADVTDVARRAGEETLAGATIPVRTGTLARSAYVEADPSGFALSASAPYAGFVHAANPFFTRALTGNEDRVLDLLTDHTTTALSTIRGA